MGGASVFGGRDEAGKQTREMVRTTGPDKGSTRQAHGLQQRL